MTDLSQPQRSLLEHAEFLRRLATQLAGPDAEDLQQDVWTAAMGRPPRHGSSPRGWLLTVANNLWRNRRRQEARRQRREQSLPADGHVPAVDEIAAREEVRRRVVAAVLQLPPQLREVVLLRFYEGLDSPAIGARLLRSPSTVRTQMQTALQRLRRRLDVEHGGERAAWAVPLLQWQRFLAEPVAAPAAVLAVRVAVLLLGGIGAAWIWWPAAALPPVDTAQVAAVTAPLRSDPAADVRLDDRTAVALPAAAWATRADVALHGEAPTGRIIGTVVDAATNAPLAGARVDLRAVPAPGSVLAGAIAPAARELQAPSAADGTFAFAALPAGCYEIAATTEDGRAARRVAFVGELLEPVTLRASGKPFRGIAVVKVLDADGRAVPAADVAIALTDVRHGAIGFAAQPPIRGVTDAVGLFRHRDPLRLEQIFEGLAVSRTADGRVGDAVIARPEHRGYNPFVEVTVAAPGRVEGRLVGPARDWSDARVELQRLLVYGSTLPELQVGCQAARVAADGTFRCDGLPAGNYHVHVDAGPACCRQIDGDIDSVQLLPSVSVRAGEVTACEIAMVTPRAIDGVVLAGGRPVAFARVRARRILATAPQLFVHGDTEPGPTSPYFEREWTTGADGTYRLPLPPGGWHIAAIAAGLSFDVQLVTAGDEPVHLRHELQPDGGLRGRAFDGLCLRRGGDSDENAPILHLLEFGSPLFAIRGLAPGSWQLGRYDNGFVRVCDVELRSGAMQWIDLSAVREGLWTGCLLVDGAPLADVEVALERGGRGATTAADGRFALPVHTAELVGEPLLVARQHGATFARFTPPAGGANRDCGTVTLRAERVTVRTVDSEGRPVAATIGVFQHGQGDDAPPTQCPDGVLRDRWILPDSGWLTVGFADGSVHERSFEPGEREITVVQPRGGRLEILLRDADGAPRCGGQLQVLAWGRDAPAPADGASFWQQCADRGEAKPATTDFDGRAVLRGIPAGPVLVWFCGSWSRFGYDTPTAHSMSLTEGAPPAEAIAVVVPGGTTFVELAMRR